MTLKQKLQKQIDRKAIKYWLTYICLGCKIRDAYK